MIETGTVLQQRYTIDRQIGQGGMGAVYIATDDRFASTVAIKETLCMDENFRKAIEREARLLNSLKHSALPKVSDHFEENNGMFLVMEYIPGDDLAAMLEDPNVRLPVDQVMAWAGQLLDALDYLHAQVIPIIHRDIKPQNLKVNSRGEIILLDFGLAKGNPTDAANHTAAKSIFGYSRSYASLEQIQGTGTDPRSDLYSLAATIYHLLTGRPPDDALTRAMSVLSAKADPLVPASSLNPEVPRGVAGVLMRAMDLNAGQRPASAAEMHQMLRESENYAYLADPSTISERIDPNVFAQKTQLMPESTRGMASDPNAKTEVLPGFVSQLTSVRPSDTGGQNTVTTVEPESPKRRRIAAGVGAALALLVVAALAGGIYIVRPDIFGSSNPIESAPTGAQAVPLSQSTTETSAATDGSPAVAEAGPDTMAGVKSAAESAPATAAPARPGENAKTTAPKNTGRNKTEDGNGNDPNTVSIEVDDPDIPDTGFVMSERDENGKLKTMRINRRTRSGKNAVRGGDASREDEDGLEQMPPEARQKLREMLRNLPGYKRPQAVPKPPKQPENE